MSVDPLNLFVQQHGRLPNLGDHPAPYTYRGWLLRYVALAHAVIPTMKDRWGYHQSIMRTAQIPNTPIPYIQFTSAHPTALKHLRACIQTASEHGQQDGLTAFIDWLAFALAVTTTPPTLSDSLQCRLYQQFQIQHMLIYPYDYFGDLISESLTSSYNHHAFFPTPHPVAELMTRMTLGDAGTGRYPRILDPCCGTSRLLLYASSYSLKIYGIDISQRMCIVTKINGALYAPWLTFPIPDDYFTDDRTSDHDRQPIQATQADHVGGQLYLYLAGC